MILVIGSHQDDVLYCASLLNQKTTETLLGRFPMHKGTIFNQEVILVSGIHTSLLCSTVTSYLLSQYYINLIIVVGKCFSLNKSFKRGEIILARDIIDIDVDQIDVANATIGQIPGMPAVYRAPKDVIGYMEDGFRKRTLSVPSPATLLCSDNLFSPAVDKAMKNKRVLGSEGPFVVDSISFGAALSGLLRDVPCVSVKAVERDISERKTIEGYVSALDTYVDIGKAVVYTIGDIGRSDILRARRGS